MIKEGIWGIGAALLTTVTAMAPSLSWAVAPPLLDEQGALATSQAAIGGQLDNFRFVDSDGQTVSAHA